MKTKKEETFIFVSENTRIGTDGTCFYIEKYIPEHVGTRGKGADKLIEGHWDSLNRKYYGSIRQAMIKVIDMEAMTEGGKIMDILNRIENLINTKVPDVVAVCNELKLRDK